ncbi:phage tail tape measure protein [Nocardiopsis lucentensis]|uniref:phage tail tape measure protein n=1 Tax=Nocardiopsis lucentensis TaxID=53441 RepID=UPI0003470EB3|nr:phage tail tape measure protein [Nocardiopsis lucentensis]
MATLQELLVKIGVDAKGVESGADRATRAVKSAFDDVQADAEKLGVTLEGIGTTAGLATGAALGVGISDALEIGSANAKLTAQLGLAEDEAARAGEVAGAVFSDGFGSSIGEVNGALAGVHGNIGELGSFTNAELEEMTTSALTLASTFDQDVNEATVAAGQLMKTGLAANGQEAFDLLAAGFRETAGHNDDLLSTVTEYSTQFRSMGLSGEQAMGLISQGLQGGARDADAVADAIKEFSIEASTGSDRIRSGFESLGLPADQLFAKIGEGGEGASEALDTTLDALRNVEDPIQRDAIATELFGTKAEDLADGLYALDPSTAALDNVSGSAQGMADTLAADPAQQFSSSIRSLTTDLASGLGPALSDVAGWASENQGTLTMVAGAVLGIAAAVTAATVALRLYQGIMVAIRVATLIWAGVQWLLNAAFWASPITWIILGIIALIAVIVLIIVYWDEIVAATGAAWDWIKEKLAAVWEWIKSTAASVWGAIAGFFVGLWESIKSAVAAAWDWVVSKISGAWEAITGKVSAAIAFVKSAISAGFNAAKNLAITAILGMHNRVVATVGRLVGFVRGIPGRIRSALGNLGSLLYNAGKNVIRGLINGIRSMFGSLSSTASSMASTIRDKLPFSPAKEGPLSGGGAPEISGARIAEGVGDGILGELTRIDRIANRLMSPLDDRMAATATTAPAAPTLSAATVAATQRSTAAQSITLDVTGGTDDLVRVIRGWVRESGGGDVTSLGRR